jgi:hypothetical protein
MLYRAVKSSAAQASWFTQEEKFSSKADKGWRVKSGFSHQFRALCIFVLWKKNCGFCKSPTSRVYWAHIKEHDDDAFYYTMMIKSLLAEL